MMALTVSCSNPAGLLTSCGRSSRTPTSTTCGTMMGCVASRCQHRFMPHQKHVTLLTVSNG
jgi:hypothetical protein